MQITNKNLLRTMKGTQELRLKTAPQQAQSPNRSGSDSSGR
jgi:hypothetical protein